MDVKSSFKTGEFWLYAIVIVGCLYLNFVKGYSIDDIKQYHDLVVAKIENFAVTWIPVILAIVYAVKRTGLKAYAMWLDLQKFKEINQK